MTGVAESLKSWKRGEDDIVSWSQTGLGLALINFYLSHFCEQGYCGPPLGHAFPLAQIPNFCFSEIRCLETSSLEKTFLRPFLG